MRRSPLVLLAVSLLTAAGCTATLPAAQPAVPPDKPHFDLPNLERRVLRELNAVRGRHGRARLAADPALTALARAHSEAMQRRSFFAHRDPDGQRGGDRARAAGYRFRTFGENLYRGRLYDTVTRSRTGGRTTTSTLWHTPARSRPSSCRCGWRAPATATTCFPPRSTMAASASPWEARMKCSSPSTSARAETTPLSL